MVALLQSVLMVQIISTAYTDDLDGTTLDSDDVRSIEWSWLGVTYELDTSAANLDAIENGEVSVARLLQVSTRTGGRRKRFPTAERVAAPEPKPAVLSGAERTRAIREWALAEGYEVSTRGRISAGLAAAYDAAH